VPSGTTGPIRVTNAGGTNISSSNFTYSPTIFTTGTSSLTTLSACIGSPSTAQSFTVSGANLTTDITVSSNDTPNIEFSTDDITYTTSLTITQTNGSVGSTTIYLRQKSVVSSAVSASKTITLASTGATPATITISSVVNALPTITLGTISNVNTSSNSFTIPYSAVANSPTLYSVSVGANALANFSPIVDTHFLEHLEI